VDLAPRTCAHSRVKLRTLRWLDKATMGTTTLMAVVVAVVSDAPLFARTIKVYCQHVQRGRTSTEPT